MTSSAKVQPEVRRLRGVVKGSPPEVRVHCATVKLRDIIGKGTKILVAVISTGEAAVKPEFTACKVWVTVMST